ncbi:MAG: hypothetical protein ACI4KM_11775 [Oscillospiraceae bacterium]
MGKKSDKKDKKAVKEEKKHGKKKSADKKTSKNIKVIKEFLNERSCKPEIVLDMESRFHISFTVQQTMLKKADGTYKVRIGMPKDETLLLVSVARSAKEMLQSDYDELNRTISSKVKYLPEEGMVECCIVMLLDNQLGEKQLNWAVHKLIMDCDYSVFFSVIHAKPSNPEEPQPEDNAEDTAPAGEDTPDILDRLLESAAQRREIEIPAEDEEEAPAAADGTVSADEEMESMRILSKLINGALKESESEPAAEAASEPISENGSAGKKSDDGFVSVSKVDMLNALFGKKSSEPETPAPEESPETPEKPDSPDNGDTPDDSDTPPDDNDGE